MLRISSAPVNNPIRPNILQPTKIPVGILVLWQTIKRFSSLFSPRWALQLTSLFEGSTSWPCFFKLLRAEYYIWPKKHCQVFWQRKNATRRQRLYQQQMALVIQTIWVSKHPWFCEGPRFESRRAHFFVALKWVLGKFESATVKKGDIFCESHLPSVSPQVSYATLAKKCPPLFLVEDSRLVSFSP